ncbi:hypothetical protein AB0I66_24515 [Streptomyces sp. NPDC050439]|uniref:hypothetical protein n=1 Tax=unclassified Streptomyces TaxID=2593676 RepID=UPI0034191745
MYPTLFTTPGVKAFAEEIDAERQRQLEKFGEQHHPDVETRDIAIVTHHYYAGRADIWREVNTERATPSTGGRCTTCPGSADGPHTHTAWDGILLEEAYEAVAEADPVKLRAELVQVAAVCAAWVADIDSRTAPDHAPKCAKCKQPFDPTDTRFDGHAQHADTPWCRGCVDNCHEGGAEHVCVICAGGQP